VLLTRAIGVWRPFIFVLVLAAGVAASRHSGIFALAIILAAIALLIVGWELVAQTLALCRKCRAFWLIEVVALTVLVLGVPTPPSTSLSVVTLNPGASNWFATNNSSSLEIVLSLRNGGAVATLSSVALVGKPGSPKPVARSESIETTTDCLWSIGAPIPPGPSCLPESMAKVTGAVIPKDSNPESSSTAIVHSLVFVVIVPHRACTAIGAVVLHYRRGDRSFTLTSPEGVKLCGAGSSAPRNIRPSLSQLGL
jgi:hypothetical protein